MNNIDIDCDKKKTIKNHNDIITKTIKYFYIFQTCGKCSNCNSPPSPSLLVSDIFCHIMYLSSVIVKEKLIEKTPWPQII